MGNEDGRDRKATVRFKNETKIMGKIVPIAEYQVKNNSETVFFIPKKGTPAPKKNELCLVFLPIDRFPFCLDEKSFYFVKIIWPEIVGGIKVFKNIFIPDSELKKLSNDKIVVTITDPEGRHRTSLLRVVTNGDNREMIKRFIEKNLLIENIWIKENGIMETVVKPLEDRNYLKNGFLKHLSELSEV